MRHKQFDISVLKYEAGQVKRHILNRVRKGELSTISKKESFLLISKRKRLRIKTDRPLWEGERKLYLDGWYIALLEDIKKIINGTNDMGDSDSISNTYTELLNKVKKQNILINEYKNLIKELRLENEGLRIKLIKRNGLIDEDF